jgi:hypothetical protein
MKKYLTLLFVNFLLLSCSQQRFTFRKKFAVKNADKAVYKEQYNKYSDTAPSNQVNNQTTYVAPLTFVEEFDKIADEPIVVIPEDTIRKKYKFDDDKSKNDSLSDVDHINNYSEQDADDDALKGFTFALLGFFIFSPLAVKGLIYSIRGLKSRNKIGFAIAGLILSGLVTLFLTFLLILMFSFIVTFGL